MGNDYCISKILLFYVHKNLKNSISFFRRMIVYTYMVSIATRKFYLHISTYIIPLGWLMYYIFPQLRLSCIPHFWAVLLRCYEALVSSYSPIRIVGAIFFHMSLLVPILRYPPNRAQTSPIFVTIMDVLFLLLSVVMICFFPVWQYRLSRQSMLTTYTLIILIGIWTRSRFQREGTVWIAKNLI